MRVDFPEEETYTSGNIKIVLWIFNFNANANDGINTQQIIQN